MLRTGTLIAAVFLGAGVLAAGAARSAATSYVSFDASSRTWKIGNALVERAFSLDPSGRFLSGSFLQKGRGRDWSPARLASPEFRLVLVPGSSPDAGSEVVRTGADGWELAGESRSVANDGTATLSVRLISAPDGLAVTLHYE